MIRLLLALALAGGAVAAPRIDRTAMDVQSVQLDRHTAGRSSEMVLAREDLDVSIAGPVASVTVRQTWRYDGTWQSPGDEASQQVRASHLSALHDYWITENGARYPGRVRDLRSAKAAYQANLARRQDPGLVEWVDEGVYHVRLYPVPKMGGTKDQGFTLVQALPVRDGAMTLRWHLPVYALERGSITIRGVNGTRFSAVTANFAVVGDAARLTGSYDRIPAGWKVLEIKLSTEELARRGDDLSWYDARGTRFLQMTPAPEFVACLAGNGAEGPAARFLRRPLAQSHGTRIPDEWLARLAASAQAMRLDLDQDRASEAMGTLAGVAQVGPGVVLYADPAQTAAQIQAGWEAAIATADTPPPAPAAPAQPGLLSRLDFQVPMGIAVPNFKCARERANGRACFANQKTLAGAIEMFCLDKNVKLGRRIFGAPVRPKGGTVTYRPPQGVEVSYWRGPERMFDYRAKRQLEPVDDPWSGTQSAADLSGPGESWIDSSDTPRAVRVPAWLLRELKDGGYLQSIPSDPGFGAGTEHNYWLTTSGNGIVCVNHGFIQGGNGSSAREQLMAAGYTGEVLQFANAQAIVDLHASRRGPAFGGWLLVLAIMTLLTAMIHLVIGVAVPAARSWSRVGECVTGFSYALMWAIPAAIAGPFVLFALFWAAVRLGQALGAVAARAMAHVTHG